MSKSALYSTTYRMIKVWHFTTYSVVNPLLYHPNHQPSTMVGYSQSTPIFKPCLLNGYILISQTNETMGHQYRARNEQAAPATHRVTAVHGVAAQLAFSRQASLLTHCGMPPVSERTLNQTPIVFSSKLVPLVFLSVWLITHPSPMRLVMLHLFPL